MNRAMELVDYSKPFLSIALYSSFKKPTSKPLKYPDFIAIRPPL